MSDDWGFPTRALHAGQAADPATGARAPPIYQTTSFRFDDAADAAARYRLDAERHIYSRISNPTVRMLEDRLTSLAGGVDAVATASGMAALDAITTTLAEVGDTVVCGDDIYGGTRAYLTHTGDRRGIEARFVETTDPDAFADAVGDRTAFVHLETIANPSLVTPDLEAIAEIAHSVGAPLVVDNTFATPALCRPLEHGADIVWHSTTKWLHGSGTTIGGVLIDGGSFPWANHPDRFPEVAAANPAFHGLNFSDRFGDRAFAATARHRAVRAVGHLQHPFDAWHTLQGIETLPVRMARHSANAHRVAGFLADHPAVAWVAYPGLPDHPTYDIASDYLSDFGGMIAFGTGEFETAKGLCESVELASFLANVGDAKTLVIHPASTTHAQLSEEEQRASGVDPDMVRLSVGLEDVEDVIADLERALEVVT